ncbi:MAG: hypothetical protein EBX37_19030 [Alphaproteobacteria bacterium]|nr:hypothetical protein [Alphaproteobacteria bacterium]
MNQKKKMNQMIHQLMKIVMMKALKMKKKLNQLLHNLFNPNRLLLLHLLKLLNLNPIKSNPRSSKS